MKLELTDSDFVNGKLIDKGVQTALYCQAIDKLNRDITNKKVDFFSFSNNTKNKFLNDKIIWYEIDDTELKNKKNAVITKAIFYTSHYIGFYSTSINNKKIDIVLNPRFGNESGIFNYLLSYAYGVYLPKGSSSSKSEKTNNLWLLAILYKATFNKAITKSQIPKEYKKMQKNLHTFKGQLHISKHIQENLFDKSRFYCSYRKLTMDVSINQTIRYTYKFLKQKGFASLLKDMGEYEQMLHSFGVEEKKITLNDIQNIKYTKLNIHYKKLMELSALLLQNSSKSSTTTASHEADSFAYFIDMAELWEDYLLKVLQKNLSEYYVYSPNEKGGVALFSDGSRSIRPDIIIEKDREVVAILDAKYKSYKQIGKYADFDGSVSREDLYQMTTYLYHYAKESQKVAGLFISPVHTNLEALKEVVSHANHKIGVLNLNIDQFSEQKLDGERQDNKIDFSNDTIQKEEENFIKKLKEYLQ
jgi:5-methylcytosine-specific restriction endonuclease McrBC regulatory subunit McrC